MIEKLIYDCIKDIESTDGETAQIDKQISQISAIPTLEQDVMKEFSPMMKKRFSMFNGWESSTHGDWLSLEEMQKLWLSSEMLDDRLKRIAHNQKSAEQEWGNDAASLFKPSRLSLFAASQDTYERIYLVWFDCQNEPELWVYDVNGSARYLNLEEYLKAFLDDTQDAYDNKWILGELLTST